MFIKEKVGVSTLRETQGKFYDVKTPFGLSTADKVFTFPGLNHRGFNMFQNHLPTSSLVKQQPQKVPIEFVVAIKQWQTLSFGGFGNQSIS